MAVMAKLEGRLSVHVADVPIRNGGNPPSAILYVDKSKAFATDRVFLRSGQEPGFPFTANARVIYKEAESLEVVVVIGVGVSDDPTAEG